MLYHPTITILISIIALMASFKYERLFYVISLLIPITSCVIFFYYAKEHSAFTIGQFTIFFDFNESNKLISSAFFFVLLIANMYSIGQNKKLEIIFGTVYASFAFMSLFAKDFISMFIGLELMMIFSSIIIFIGGKQDSIQSAKKYFLIHIISSNMIVTGIAHLILKNNNLAIVPSTMLLHNSDYSCVMVYFMLIGMLINIAAFPFSGWMVKYYPKASPSGFLYLIVFTTKISVTLITKIFPGLHQLKYMAILMIVYASYKSLIEKSIFSLLCYLSIISMGIMMLAISVGTERIIFITNCYLFLHIIYKSLLSISTAVLADELKIYNCQDIVKINNKVVLLGIVTGILIMISIPLSLSFIIKSVFVDVCNDTISYITIMFSSFIMVCIIPWKKYFHSTSSVYMPLNLYSRTSIISTTIAVILVNIFYNSIPVLYKASQYNDIHIFSLNVLKQCIIVLLSFFIANKYSIGINSQPLNFNTWYKNLIYRMYRYWIDWYYIQKRKIIITLLILQKTRVIRPYSIIANQYHAIFIVFTVFIILLVVLNTSV